MTRPSGEDAPAGTAPSPGVRGSPVAIAGLLFAALFLIAWLMMRDSPSLDATDEQLRSYYGDPDKRRSSMIAGLYLIPFAGIAFIWFMAALRDRYMRTAAWEHTILSTAHVVAGALVVVSLFTLAAAELAVVWLAEAGGDLDVDGARALLALGQASADIMALRSAAVFVGVSASRGVRSGLFPRAHGIASFVTAAALLLAYESAPWVSLLFPLWVAVSAVLVLVRRRAVEGAEGA